MESMTESRSNAGECRSARLSVSLPGEVHEIVGRIARHKKVSVAWVVRDAVEQYIQAQWPLLDSK